MKSFPHRFLVWTGSAISLFCLYLVFRSVPLEAFVGEWKQVRWPMVLPVVGVFYLGVYFRGSRWWWLLPVPGVKLTRRGLWQGVFVGYAFNNILPSGRVGELARALFVAKAFKLPVSRVLGTVVNDRVFDSLILLFLVGSTSLWIFPLQGDGEVSLGGFHLSAATLNPLFVNVALGSLGIILMVLLLLIPRVAEFLNGLVGRLPFLPGRFRDRCQRFVGGMLEGLRAVCQLRRLGWVSYFTFLIWGLNAAAAYALAWAIPGLEMTWFQAIGLMALVSVCAAIPAAPGYWGLYEAGMIISFQVLEIHEDQSIALVYAVTMHLIYYLPTTILGLIWAFRSAISPGASLAVPDLEKERDEEQ